MNRLWQAASGRGSTRATSHRWAAVKSHPVRLGAAAPADRLQGRGDPRGGAVGLSRQGIGHGDGDDGGISKNIRRLTHENAEQDYVDTRAFCGDETADPERGSRRSPLGTDRGLAGHQQNRMLCQVSKDPQMFQGRCMDPGLRGGREEA